MMTELDGEALRLLALYRRCAQLDIHAVCALPATDVALLIVDFFGVDKAAEIVERIKQNLESANDAGGGLQ